MRIDGRVLGVTLCLALAGGVFGAVAGGVAILAAIAVTEGPRAALNPYAFGMAGLLGGILGSVLLPAAGWLLMRRVPLGVAVLGTVVGTVAGGVAGWVLGYGGSPLVGPIWAAVLGFGCSTVALRLRYRGARALPGAPAALPGGDVPAPEA